MYQLTLKPRTTFDNWRTFANNNHLSPGAKQRLEWLIFYFSVGKKNALTTASYFGIPSKTFHKWKKRFDPNYIQSLEENSKAPHKRRAWQVTLVEEERIVSLRKKFLKYGKGKLKVLYLQEYGEVVSTWKIERVIRKHRLYPALDKYRKLAQRRPSNKKKIQQLIKEGYQGTLWHTDTIIIYWYGERKVIFTALEDTTKVSYSRVYKTNSSRKAKDFLERLVYLSQGDIKIIHSDNGSEFAGEFERACQELGIQQVYSRVRTPKDNSALERYNRTIQEEWLELSEVGLDDILEANLDLTNWLIEYNNHRPHQALDYLTPLAYAVKIKVLPMYPASTL